MKQIEIIYKQTIEEAVSVARDRKREYDLRGIETLVTITETNRPIRWRVEIYGDYFYEL